MHLIIIIFYRRYVNDQDEVGFASSKRCKNERRLTLNTDCIYTYDEVIKSDIKKHTGETIRNSKR